MIAELEVPWELHVVLIQARCQAEVGVHRKQTPVPLQSSKPIPPGALALAVQDLIKGEEEAQRQELKSSLVRTSALPDTGLHELSLRGPADWPRAQQFMPGAARMAFACQAQRWPSAESN